ncbi:hypothetical protein RY831_11495 [Noviherbaspirillum sp. CPCC 100848]|uniref:EF-hand domain-containing protein n=1 Tax=Noviherbaspirillum album TaxID=3080276 RepID=A0ABU6J8B9_9BURK|nr:hypothetical protein [Noviherbaspirillum sp. CPCC 100848]MEC4719775.1 hypothetical protein [Noviherbaspirillum sp. CPCC 100848]
MSDPVTRKTHNYDPNNFKVPEFRKDKDGKLDPTDYQAAVGLKDFMQRNNVLFVNGDHQWEANSKGTVTFGDRVVQLNDQEKAMFKKLSDGLLDRLDAGDNGTHDNVVGGKDIDKAIRNSWILHGNKTSSEGYWTDPNKSVSTTKQQAKERLVELMEKGHGARDPKGEQTFSSGTIESAVNRQRLADLKKNEFDKYLDDPTAVQGFVLLHKDFHNVDTDKNGNLTLEELKNWKV